MSEHEGSSGIRDEELSSLIDGELTPARAAALRARIAADPRLAERLAALERVDAALRALPARSVPPSLAAGLRARIAREAAPAPRRRLGWTAAAAGMAAAAAAAAWLLLRAALWPVPGAPAVPEVLVAELESASEEEIAIAIDLDTLDDLEVIEQLDLLERLDRLERRERG